MALSKNLKRIGAAAHNEKRDDWENIEEASRKHIPEKQQEFLDLLDQLRQTPNWEIWYDDNDNVPDFSKSDWNAGRLDKQIQAIRTHLKEGS